MSVESKYKIKSKLHAISTDTFNIVHTPRVRDDDNIESRLMTA